MSWQPIPENLVRHIWYCNSCADEDTIVLIEVDLSFYETAGTPICGECGDDMAYFRTEVFCHQNLSKCLKAQAPESERL